MLSRECATIGLKKFLETLKLKFLQKMGENMEWDNEKNKVPSSKQILAKRIHEEMEKVGPKKFLDDVSSSVLEEIFKDMDIEKPSSKSKYAETLLEESETWGLEKIFLGLPLAKLKECAEACGLTVESSSIDILVDCIVRQENHKAPKKKVSKQEKVSKKKPDIKKGISKTDLNTHYYSLELKDYCKENDLNTSGSKKDYILRILAHVEGRPQPRVPKKHGVKRRRKDDEDDKPEKKAKKNEKSSKDKSEKKLKRKNLKRKNLKRKK